MCIEYKYLNDYPHKFLKISNKIICQIKISNNFILRISLIYTNANRYFLVRFRVICR